MSLQPILHRFRGLSLALLASMTAAVSPSQTLDTDTSDLPVTSKGKKGWTWGALPVVAYDADQGFQFGALGQVFYYGDGSTYPEYRHTIYAEASWFTKGGAIYQLFYDSKYLIPGQIRLTADVSYLTERALDFYGFNGYEANYLPALTDPESEEYISRMYYRYQRRMLRVLADLQGPILKQRLRWLAGINYFNIETATVDIDRINKGKSDEKQLPDTALLYDRYVQYGLIGGQEKNGGNIVYLKLGLVYDTRDIEAAPSRGVWSEVILMSAPTFLGNNPFAFVKLAITHRQYITLVRNRLVTAYRMGYQGTIAGSAPFYIEPYMYNSWSLSTKPDGLGGAKTLRGILRNRVVGAGVAFANLELRWKFLQGTLFKQQVYLGMLGFLDGGMVVQDHPVYRNLVPDVETLLYFNRSRDGIHWSAGFGLRAALNENFIVSLDYGFAFDKQDGNSGLYIGIGHVF